MRDRHLPRLCGHCHAPLARQEDACWRCGTQWASEVAPQTESLGHANVVFADDSGSMTAAADPRSDGAAVVAHYPRFANP